MILKKFENDDKVLGRTNKVSSGFWSDGNFAVSQSYLYTSSVQSAITGSTPYDILSGLYYYNVYYKNPETDPTSQVHFAVAYGDYAGSGSSAQDTSSLFINSTKAIYSQYKNYLLGTDDSLFSFRTGSLNPTTNTDNTTTIDGESIFTIAFSSDKFKDRIDEGQLEFSLSGSLGCFSFIDDSSVINKSSDVYSIVSGSVNQGIPLVYKDSGGKVPYNAIGLFYPKTGTVILNASTISSSVGITVSRTNGASYALNHGNLIGALSNAGTKSFKIRKSEFLPAMHYFIRVKNRDFNYTNNPTYVSNGTDGNLKGTIKVSEFITNPKTYITTVGLYNDANELVAVAKMSQPILKSFDNEISLKIRIDT